MRELRVADEENESVRYCVNGVWKELGFEAIGVRLGEKTKCLFLKKILEKTSFDNIWRR